MSITIFWVTLMVITAIFIGLIWLSSLRAKMSSITRGEASNALRSAQLDELNRNIDAGNVTAGEADAMRAEIERAYSRATRRGEDGVEGNAPKFLAPAIIAACTLTAILGYYFIGAPGFPDIPFTERAALLRPTQEKAIELLGERDALPSPDAPSQEVALMIEELEAVLAESPDEARGWQILARVKYSISDYQRAAEAQSRYIALAGDAVTADDYAMLAENFVLSVNGYVSPEAEEALKSAISIDRDNQIARFYTAMLAKQEGQPRAAQNLLQGLLDDGIENPDWRLAIENELASLGFASGPSAEDLENASNMSEADRVEMITTMVDGLKERLAIDGGTPDEWARLISSLRVLGRNTEADTILAEARQKFPDHPSIQAIE